MALDKFRSQTIVWDKANRKVYENVRVSSEDENGRKLAVQIVNDGVVEDLTGFSLSLAWETRDKVSNGLDAFEVIDISKGQFSITYKTGMLKNVGNLNAQLVLIGTDTSKITSENFTITVFGGVGTDGAESSNEFSALTTALATVNQYDARIESKADKSTTDEKLLSLSQQLTQTEQDLSAQLAQTVKKGEAREDTNLRPINVAEMDTETKQLFTGGAVAVVGEDMVGAENIKTSAVNGEHISSDGFSKISALQLESPSHNLIYGADGSKSINDIFSHSGDTYFNKLHQNGVSVINNSFSLSNGNFFFYDINKVDDLKSKGKVSLAVKILSDHANFKKEYRFLDSSGSQIGTIQSLTNRLNDWFFVNSVLIPAEAAVVSFRLDARTVPIGTTVAFAFPSVFAGEYVGNNYTNNILDKITDVNKRVDNLQGSGSIGEYPLPKGFKNNGFNLMKKSGAEIGHNHDLSTYTASPDITLFVSTTGASDTNNGSASSPLRTLIKAWETIQASTWNHAVIYASGEYRRTELPASWVVPDGKTLSIVGDGNTLFYAGDRGVNYTWTADGSAFKTSRANCNNIIDTTMTADENGIVPPLTKVDSLAEVQSTQGSWYTDTISVWVRLHDDRQPDAKVYSILYNENMRFVIEGSGKVFLSNFQRFGIVSPVGVNGNGTFIQDRLKISCAGHNAQSDGYALLDVKNSFSFDTIIAYSAKDGFNYHYTNTPVSERRTMLAVEFGCKSYGNGKDAGDQASTAHEGISVIRANGTYASDVGAGIADVNGCDSVFVNVNASSNLAEGIKVTQDIGIAPVRSTLDNVSAYTASNAIPAFSSEYARVRNSQIYPHSVDKIETF